MRQFMEAWGYLMRANAYWPHKKLDREERALNARFEYWLQTGEGGHHR